VSDPLAGWTGAGIGEGVALTNLYAREQPSTDARAITLWESGTTLLLWHASGLWYWCSDLSCRLFGWSSGAYIRRTL
jgi:hypothetical protein